MIYDKNTKNVSTDLFSEFGDPADSDFENKIKSQLIEINLPFPLNKGKTHVILCHAVIADSLLDAFENLGHIYGEKNMSEMNIDNYHGCFNIRPVVGWPGYWSTHSWACAIDLNAHLGQMGKPSTMPYHFVKVFEDRGFYWGGHWSRPDGMHFSLVKN